MSGDTSKVQSQSKFDYDHRPWQDDIQSSSTALKFLLNSGTHSDITFVVGREGRQFRVHRLIMATRSPVFEDMLLLDSSHSKPVLCLKEDSSEAFQWVLQHIYCDRNDLDTIDLALKVLSFSDKYMIASGYDTCIRYLQKVVKRNNVLKLYRNLKENNTNSEILLNICRKVFLDNGNAVLMSKNLLELPEKYLLHLLQEPLRINTEVVVFKAIITWANYQLKQRGKPSSSSNIRKEITPFLPHIRFLTMTTEEFVQNVVISDLLTPDETVFILKFIAKPNSDGMTSQEISSLAQLISTNRERRLPLLIQEQIRTCLCEPTQRILLKDRVFEFQLVTSDNLMILAFHLQTEEKEGGILVEIRKSDPQSPVLARTESQSSNISFRNPVYIREGVTYNVRILLQDPNIFLYGLKKPIANFTTDNIEIQFIEGVFIHGIVFV